MKPLTIIHFSDLHEAAPLQSCDAFFDKRLIGRLNSIFTRRFDRNNIRKAVPLFLKQAPDLFVFTGDATTCSQPVEFEMALDDLKPLINSGIPILYSPGNHDCYVKDEICRNALEEFIRKLTAGRQNSHEELSLLDFDRLRTISIHTALPTNPFLSCGKLTISAAEKIKTACTDPQKTNLLVSHFPILHPDTGISGLRRKMYGAGMLHDLPLELILCGHIHRSYAIPHESNAGSLAKYGTWSMIRFENGTFSIQPRSV